MKGHPADPSLPHYVTARLLWYLMESRRPKPVGGQAGRQAGKATEVWGQGTRPSSS